MSKISYDALKIQGLKEVFIQIKETCSELDIDFMIVGAIARNIWYVSNDETPLGTKDIDFGVYISDVEKYNQLRKKLNEKYGYIVSSENPFCLITKDGKEIDLLPFGEIEEQGQVLIEGKGLTSINLDGFKESYTVGAIETTIGDEIYRSCSVPGIVILKLIAYDDRPEIRTKDIIDINSICKYYPFIEESYIWDNHHDLYDDEKEHFEVGLIVLGREMKKIVGNNESLKKRLISIMTSAVNFENNILSLMIQDPKNETVEDKRDSLNSILIGFTE